MNTYAVRALQITAIAISMVLMMLPLIKIHFYNEALFGSFVPLIMWLVAYRTARWNTLSIITLAIVLSCISTLAAWFFIMEMLTSMF